MIIKSLKIKNCKSFKSETLFTFNNNLNILVGPNGGGKSNTLDIINILLRFFFMKSYKLDKEQNIIYEQSLYKNDIRPFLEKFSGYEDEESFFEIEFKIQENDINNINSLIKYKDQLEKIIDKYSQFPFRNLNRIEAWNKLEKNQVFGYTVKNWKPPENQDSFYEYLTFFNLFNIINRENKIVNLKPPFLYISPYRGTSIEDFQAKLSLGNYYDLLIEYHQKTSNDISNLIKLASTHFARKKRVFESNAKKDGYEIQWDNDEEIKLINKYIQRLGYKWNSYLKDENKNIYEIELKVNDRTINIGQASSGEKEILNFLLGIFAFQIQGGVVLIDEPELHLHPKWQGLLRDLFIELSEISNNQFITCTHSPVFIAPHTLPYIHRLSRNSIGETIINSIEDDEIGNQKDLLHIVNSHNNEKIFFADHVVLVEGIKDRLIFEKIINHTKKDLEKRRIIDKDRVFEVVEVFGKGNFNKYKEFLDEFGLEVSIIADQDYLLDIPENNEIKLLFETDYKKIEKSVLKDKKSKDCRTLAEHLDNAINNGQIDKLKIFFEYIKCRFLKLNDGLNSKKLKLINDEIERLYDSNIYILKKGEIEDYLPKKYRNLDKTIDLVKPDTFRKWIEKENSNEYLRELNKIVLEILGTNKMFKD